MIRMAGEGDLPRILEIYGPYVTGTTASFEYEVPALVEFTRRFREITAQFPWLVWEDGGVVAGYAYASAPFHRAGYAWCCEVSVYVDPVFQGRGVGRALYGDLERILRKQGYRLIYAIITDENSGSIAFHKAVGYRFTAHLPGCGVKFGKILGVIYMEKVLDFVGVPGENPASWREIGDFNRN